ncbi:MAG: cell division protein FtsQ/DivIB [Lachnospiraceae bacterium]|nr:cell division protein FtsQ/DivIB [Lachnospiraceae bacterium]
MRAFRFYFMNILLGILIVGIASVVGIAMFCSIHKVSVEGNTIYTDEEITQLVLDGKYPNNSVYEALHNTLKPKKDIPFVSKVTVKLTGYDKLSIKVVEKDCVGYLPLEKGGYAYFDQNGSVVEVSERLIDKSIGVSGVTLKKAEVGQKVELEKEQLNLMVQLLKAMQKYELEISGLSFDEAGNATVSYGDILISVGKADFLEEKMMRLPYILPQVEGQAGTLHLENWTKDNTDIVFRKRE